MKKIYSIILCASLAACQLLTISCVDDVKFGDNFLDKAKGEDVNEDLIFSKKVYTEYLLWQCYEGLYCPFKSCYSLNAGVMEALSDIMHSELGWDDIGRMFYTGNLTAANANPGWCQSRFAFISQGGIQNMSNTSKRSIWNCVRDCELLIDNVDRVPDMTAAEKARFKAEARIILASKYLDGIRHFGGLPIVDHAFKGDDQIEEGRSTIEKTVNFAVGLLDEAIAEPNLPWNLPDNEIATWEGRVTKASAIALKAKLLNYAASPIFNSDKPYCTEEPQDAVEARQVWYGNYDVSRWQAVVDACEQFFTMNSQNGNYYQLMPAINRSVALSKYRDGYRDSYNSQFGTRDAIIARSADDVLMVAEAYVRKKDYNSAITYLNMVRDRAGYANGEDRAKHVDGGQAYKNNSVCTGGTAGHPGTECPIYCETNTYYESNNIPVSTASTKSSMHLNSVDDILNSVVDGPIYQALNLQSEYDKVMCFILDERTRELIGESQRWEDLARTKTLEARWKTFNCASTLGQGTFDPKKHYFRPIPQSFLDDLTNANGQALTKKEKAAMQNPGY